MSRPPIHTAPPLAAAPASRHPTRAGLGLGTLLATSIGVIVGQVGTVSLLQGVGLGGWGFIGAFAVAFALASLNAMAYAEMALLMPQAGSLSRYTEAALGPFPAILLVFAGYVAPCIFGLPAELLLLDGVVRQALPFVVPPYVVPVALVVLLAALNILGTDLFAKVQGPLSFTALGLLAVTAGVAWWSPHGVVVPLPAGAAPLGWQAFGRDTVFLGMIALAFWVFVGSEFVTPLTREARDPQRDLPRAMLGGLALIFGTQLAFALGTVWFVPREQLASSATPHVDYLAAVFGPAAQGWYAVFAVIASASLVNALFAAVPRMLGDMALRGQVPVLRAPPSAPWHAGGGGAVRRHAAVGRHGVERRRCPRHRAAGRGRRGGLPVGLCHRAAVAHRAAAPPSPGAAAVPHARLPADPHPRDRRHVLRDAAQRPDAGDGAADPALHAGGAGAVRGGRGLLGALRDEEGAVRAGPAALLKRRPQPRLATSVRMS